MSIVPSGPPRKRGSSLAVRFRKTELYTKRKRSSAGDTEIVYKKKKLFDGNPLPECQKSDLIQKLRNIEGTLDQDLATQRRQVYSLLNQPPNMLKGVMRVHIYNTHVTQQDMSWWDLRIQGKLIHPDLRLMYNKRQERSYVRAFSSFFKAIRVVGENGEMIGEWKKQPGQRETEGLGIKKPSQHDMNVRIQLFLDYNPQQYKLSNALSLFVGSRQENRENILTLLWSYVVKHKLQDTEDPRYINNDSTLYSIFNEERTDLGLWLKILMDTHLSDPDPIEILHRIKLSGEWIETEHIYNIAVDVEDPFQLEVTQYLSEGSHSLFSKQGFVYNIRNPADLERSDAVEDPIANELKTLNNQLEKLKANLTLHVARKEFFQRFIKNPKEAMQELKDEQNKAASEYYAPSKYDEINYDPDVGEGATSFFQQGWVKDLVERYIEESTDLS